MVRAVLLPPLPFPNSGQLVEIQLRDRKNLRIERRFATGADRRVQNRTFGNIAAHRFALLNFAADGPPDALYGASFFADAGRYFLPTEDRPGHAQGDALLDSHRRRPLRQSRDGMRCLVLVRLKPGVSVAQAQADRDAVAARIERDSPKTNTRVGVRVVPLPHSILGRARPAIVDRVGRGGFPGAACLRQHRESVAGSRSGPTA